MKLGDTISFDGKSYSYYGQKGGPGYSMIPKEWCKRMKGKITQLPNSLGFMGITFTEPVRYITPKGKVQTCWTLGINVTPISIEDIERPDEPYE